MQGLRMRSQYKSPAVVTVLTPPGLLLFDRRDSRFLPSSLQLAHILLAKDTVELVEMHFLGGHFERAQFKFVPDA